MFLEFASDTCVQSEASPIASGYSIEKLGMAYSTGVQPAAGGYFCKLCIRFKSHAIM